ncbi:MAG: hypothetical protein JOY71_27535 [Acetobacteraceae bacterium]|nr:hypothetical protein [Acetobacteraceae bacterium]MBV8525822.1 hypothetical protein [Acetobacteraceae bacterium]
MPYELRIDGKPHGRFETAEDAEAEIRVILHARPNAECELWDTETGKPLAPAATQAHREYLANKVGF